MKLSMQILIAMMMETSIGLFRVIQKEYVKRSMNVYV